MTAFRTSIDPACGAPHLAGGARPVPPRLERAGAGSLALSVRGVTRTYHAGIRGCSGRVAALRGVDLDVARGTALGVLGPPGSGRTTLLLCLAGLLRPDGGTIRWFGRLADEAGPPAGLAYVPAPPAAWGFMAVREAVEYHAVLRDLDAGDRGDAVGDALARTGLESRAHAAVGNLPADDLERLAVARALVGRPRLLVLDDTLAALDGPARHDLAEALRDLVAEGTTIVIAGPDLTALELVASRVALMLDGRIVAVTDASALRRASAIELTIAGPPEPSGPTADPSGAATGTAARVAESARAAEVMRVPLENMTPEAVLAHCQARGLRVRRSRVILGDEA